jgi:co-chaperonin GroES (HSP10)
MSIGVTVKGKLRPIRNHVLVCDMSFDAVTTSSGIFIPSQNGKTEGIKPRWGRVYAVGPEQTDVKVGEWIYIEHGRWTRGATVEDDDGNILTVRRVDNDAIMLQTDELPSDVYIPK